MEGDVNTPFFSPHQDVYPPPWQNPEHATELMLNLTFKSEYQRINTNYTK